MKSIVNEPFVRRRANLGKYALFAGMAVLAAGLILSLTGRGTLLVVVGALGLGWLLSTVGSANTVRWLRRPRADEVLAHGIKGFDDRYRLYNYILPAPHVLLSPAGLLVLTAMRHEGRIRYQDGRWRRDFSLWRAVRFMTEEGLGRPDSLAEAEAMELRKWLDRREGLPDVEVQSALVFVHPSVELDAKDSPRAALLPADLGRFVRRQKSASPLGKTDYFQLRRLFDEMAGEAET